MPHSIARYRDLLEQHRVALIFALILAFTLGIMWRLRGRINPQFTQSVKVGSECCGFMDTPLTPIEQSSPGSYAPLWHVVGSRSEVVLYSSGGPVMFDLEKRRYIGRVHIIGGQFTNFRQDPEVRLDLEPSSSKESAFPFGKGTIPVDGVIFPNPGCGPVIVNKSQQGNYVALIGQSLRGAHKYWYSLKLFTDALSPLWLRQLFHGDSGTYCADVRHRSDPGTPLVKLKGTWTGSHMGYDRYPDDILFAYERYMVTISSVDPIRMLVCDLTKARAITR